ncbi:hypothetical protein WN944_018904 [Citrus x changshan-huyou]|uniref:Uncharacterized protein n=1 Tax=Citrus x changshan-huyou TaxID=2935761 RepID=A0AAP0LU81_9ROSI
MTSNALVTTNVQTVEFEGEMLYLLCEVSKTFDVERCLSSLDQIVESEWTEGHGDAVVQNKQQEAVEEEALLAQQNNPIELSCLDNILEIVESKVEIDSLPDRLVFYVQKFLSELDQTADLGIKKVENCKLWHGKRRWGCCL